MKGITLFRVLSPLGGIVKRWRRSRLRDVIRGYRVLKRNGNQDLIANIQSTLTETPLGLAARDFASSIFGVAIESGELVVRQYLLLRIGGLSLSAALLRALVLPSRKLVFPMPFQWRAVLEQHGFQPSHWRCELLWKLYTFAAWGYGVVQIGSVLLAAITSRSDRALPRDRHVYFVSLSQGNLPQREGGVTSHDIVSWYLQWEDRDRQIASVRHSVAGVATVEVDGVAVRSQLGPLPAMSGLWQVFRYLAWGVIAALTALVSFFRGYWWNALLLNQAAVRAQAALTPADSLAREYFFHNSGWLYRPLWTYELGSKQSRATLYFYSINCERFKTPQGYPGLGYGYGAMNWPHYLVWDRYQADFVRRATGAEANISQVGPIWFSSNAESLPAYKGRYIALFDLTPVRFSRYCELAPDDEFYTPEVINTFLQDAVAVVRQYEARILWKRKRKTAHAHPVYRHFITLLDQEETIIQIDLEISTIRVIEACCAVISIPFTSTAILGKLLGKPSVYYDPSRTVQRDDRAAHGIEILTGRDELERWMQKISNTEGNDLPSSITAAQAMQ
jgi:polysaccharide biosynthesis PFTS motif protein